MEKHSAKLLQFSLTHTHQNGAAQSIQCKKIHFPNSMGIPAEHPNGDSSWTMGRQILSRSIEAGPMNVNEESPHQRSKQLFNFHCFCFFCGAFLHKPQKGWPFLKALQTIQNSVFCLLSSTWNIYLLMAQFHIEGIRIRCTPQCYWWLSTGVSISGVEWQFRHTKNTAKDVRSKRRSATGDSWG